MKVEYPILPNYSSDPTEEEKEKTIATYFGHHNRAGFFPVGKGNTWHGGIHIEDLGNPVRVIADGRIIAYRIPEDYLSEKNNPKAKYSNGFILIQHDFETPKKVKLRFYSLYMHLQPKKAMEQNHGRNVPKLYAKYTVKTKRDQTIRGLKVRNYDETDEKKSSEIKFIPRGGTLTKHTVKPPKEHWMYKNKGYVFCKVGSKIVCAYKPWLIDRGDYYQVNHIKAIDRNTINPSKLKGTMIYNAVEGNHSTIESVDTEFEVELLTNRKWYKIKNADKFILKRDCHTLTKTIKDDVQFDTIVNVDVPIQAGKILGVPSKYESKIQQHYNIVHLEVFTDDDGVKKFINNGKDKDRTSYEVEAGKTLQVAKPCNFLKTNTKVKIYQKKEEYTLIGFENLTCTTDRSKLVYHNKTKRKYYTIKPEHFATVNALLENVLPTANARLYYKSENGNNRKIEYKSPNAGKKYWVKASEVTGEVGTWVKLTTNISTFYEKEPTDETADVTIEETTKVRKASIVKDSQNVKWLYVKTKDQGEGWIKKSELTEKNPYKWSDYGWKLVEDTGDQYLYVFGKSVDKKQPHDFIKQIWEQADTDGNKLLEGFEMQQAMQNKAKQNKISKLICKHESEWNTWNNISKYEKELKDLYKVGISKEEEPSKKQELEKKRDDNIARLKDKIEQLSFWDKLELGDVISKEERWQIFEKKHPISDKPVTVSSIAMDPMNAYKSLKKRIDEFNELDAKRIKRQFPTSNSKVYHFHPIAFVEHMKLISGRRAPWMEIALEQAKLAQGTKEGAEPMYSMAKGYLRFVGNRHEPTDGQKGPWCAAFMNWCMSESGYKFAKSASSLAPLSYKGHYKKIETPIYGAIVVYRHVNKKKWKGHTGFLYGMTNKGEYLLLGGNQGDTITLSPYGEYTSSSKTKKLEGFYVPIDYEISESDYLVESDFNLNVSKENRKIGVAHSKGSGKTT